MIEDSCPIPNKKQRTHSSPDSSDSEEWNLSRTFDEDYRTLMNEEILKICRQTQANNENFEANEGLRDFIRHCDDLLRGIHGILMKPKQKDLCRCDTHLDKFDKISCVKRLFESPKFTNLSSLANKMISNQPHLTFQVQEKLAEFEKDCQSKYLNYIIDTSIIVKDINADIDDLKWWLTEVRQKLNLQVDKQRMEYIESIENILNDFKVHDDMKNSITKTIEKVIQHDSTMEFSEAISDCRIELDNLISLIHSQWLQAMELRFKLESMTDVVVNYNPSISFGVNMLGQESGFESEISPMNPMRGFPRNNLLLMKYISSSGECMIDNFSTDIPMDSDSTDLSVDFLMNKSMSSSTSTIDNMSELPRQSVIVKEELPVRKRHKRLKKRRPQHSKSLECNQERCLPIRDLFKPSLKRRIIETNIIQALGNEGETSCRISDLAATAEKIVMRNNDMNHTNDSLSESPKESELDDGYGAPITSAHEWNLKDVWDNYQASLYSNDDGDSQILDVDKIRDWEQDQETDDQDYESCYNDKALQILTSGYETSMESDIHLCNKNLINILKFSASQQVEVSGRVEAISKQLDLCKPLIADKIDTLITEQFSVSKTHVKLLGQILNNEPCDGNQNEPLVNEMRLLLEKWENVIRKIIITQSRRERSRNNNHMDKLIDRINKIDRKISNIGHSKNLADLELSIELLKKCDMELLDVSGKIVSIQHDVKYVLNKELASITRRVSSLNQEVDKSLRLREQDWGLLTSCNDKLKVCQKKRKFAETQLKCFTIVEKSSDWESISSDVMDILGKNRETLESCLANLDQVSYEHCREDVQLNLQREMKLLDELNDQLALVLPVIENLRSTMSSFTGTKSLHRPNVNSATGLLNRLPVQVAIFVIVAVFGLWYKQQSSYSCQTSTDWFKLFRKYTSNMEPH